MSIRMVRSVGLDVHKRVVEACIVDHTGNVVHRERFALNRHTLTVFATKVLRPSDRVALEATTNCWAVADVLRPHVARVLVSNPMATKAIAQAKVKTDKVDARVLCELLRIDALPHPVHMPGRETRALRGLLVARRQLVAARTKLCNVVRGMLRQEGIRLPDRALASFAGWERVFVNSFSCEHVMTVVRAYYQSFQALTQSIRELERKLGEYERTNPEAKRLQTIPKVGRIASLTFLAAVDDVNRFPSSRKLVAYSGLAPTVRQSSERTEYGPISREGRRELRAVWVQIAHLVAVDRHRETQPLRTWYNRVARRRGQKTAVVALARRLLVIAYHLLREETDFDATRLKRRAA